VDALDLSPRGIARLVFAGGLLLALVIGLVWAFNPAEEGGVRFSGTPDDRVAQEAEEGDEDTAVDPDAPAVPSPEPEAEPEPEDTGPPPEELIAAAPEPSETSVQVLDAGGGRARTEAVVAALEDLGYLIVNVTSSRTDVRSTTVWFTEGSEEAALALRARDERVVEVAENERLSPGVNLHVLVGPDWETG
jgi:hypothetical protein